MSIRRGLVVFASTAGIGIVLLTSLVFWCGPGDCTEFSPKTFQFRNSAIWNIPILNTPVFPRVTSTYFHPLLEMWKEQGYFTDSEMADCWDLAGYWAPGCDRKSTIIHDLVCAKAIGSPEYWRKWSTDNPDKAAKLWPAVIGLIRTRRYEEAYLKMRPW